MYNSSGVNRLGIEGLYWFPISDLKSSWLERSFDELEAKEAAFNSDRRSAMPIWFYHGFFFFGGWVGGQRVSLTPTYFDRLSLTSP